MIPLKTEQAWRGTSDCLHCSIRHMVLFADLQQEDFHLIHGPIDDLLLRRGQSLYPERGQAQHLFTVRSGMVKLSRLTDDGRVRILRILRPGDVAGIEALASGVYDSEASALTEVSVCRIPLDVVQQLQAHSPRIHQQLLRKWHQALKEADDWLADINFGTARQRVRHFTLKMRHPADPGITTLFSREDMGAMMDLTLETVSREVSAMVHDGLIEPLGRGSRIFRILDAQRLHQPK